MQRRNPEEHGDVAELEIGIDQRYPTRIARREQDGKIGRDHALADATLGGEGREDAALLGGLGRGRGAVRDVGDRLSDPLDRHTNLTLAGIDGQRVTHAGAQRLLQQRHSELVREQHHPDRREAARDALHRLEPRGT